jgi:signal transduction histidine kinase/PAS domain-containing protein
MKSGELHMNKSQVATQIRSKPTGSDVKDLLQLITTAHNNLQAFTADPDRSAFDQIAQTVALLEKAKETARRLDGLPATLQPKTTQSQARQVELEEELRHLNRDLHRRIAELQTLLDVLPVGIVVSSDPGGINMTINPAGLKLLNLPSQTNPSKSAPGGEGLPFKVLKDGKEVPPAELPMQYAAAHDVEVRDVEIDVLRTDGTLLNLYEYASPLYDEDGRVRGSLGVLVDITSRKNAERRLIMQYEIARILAESNSISQAATKFLKIISDSLGWEFSALWRVEPEGTNLTNEGVWHTPSAELAGFAETTIYSFLEDNPASLLGKVLHSGELVWTSDFTSEIPSPRSTEASQAGLRSALAFPIRSGAKITAILECYSRLNQSLDQTLIDMLNAFGDQIGIFLERKWLEETLAERATQQHLLAQVGLTLSSSMDYVERVKNVTRLVVPDIADWCAVDYITHDNMVERLAAAHVDPDKEKLIYEIQPTHPVVNIEPKSNEARSFLNGQSILFADFTPAMLEEMTVDTERLRIARILDPRSVMIVPLKAHGKLLGDFVFILSESRRRYSLTDLGLAEDIAQRLALAVDNAQLYAEAQKLNGELEKRVADRTAQLHAVVVQLTNQMAERRQAEEQVRVLNAELEQRVEDRTLALENANRDLHIEITGHQQASQSLHTQLTRTRELYRISQAIGKVRDPNEVLRLLLKSSYLKSTSRASIALLDKPWIKGKSRPRFCTVIAEWNKGSYQPRFINRQFTLEEYGVVQPYTYGLPITILDIQSKLNLSEASRQRFAALRTHGLIILPLVAGGEWYGLLSLHFESKRVPKKEDLRHMRGLVDETAIAIRNIHLLEQEAAARREAEQANQLKLKFLAMISHELRTPLTSIKGFSTTLLAEDIEWPATKQRDFLQTIDEESDKLGDLIEQLLDMSRMEAGILRISPKKQSMNDIFISSEAQMRAITSDHVLVLKITRDLPLVSVDGQRIAQVLTNLAGNAAKYSPQRTRITISAYPVENAIQVDVADQGIGIPAKDREHVFEAFRQLESSNRTRGAGLGLAICKGLVEAHGGKIWIQERTEPGTVVSFTLPTRARSTDFGK